MWARTYRQCCQRAARLATTTLPPKTRYDESMKKFFFYGSTTNPVSLAQRGLRTIGPATASGVNIEGWLPHRSAFNNKAQISALLAGGVAGGMAYIQWEDSKSSVRCEEKSASAKPRDDANDPGPAAKRGNGQNKEDGGTNHGRHRGVIATSGRYHLLADAESQVDEMMQTAQAVVDSGVDRIKKTIDDSGLGSSLRAASEARSTAKKSFTVLAAQLDAKNEREKVQLARFLRELHALASESNSYSSSSSSEALSNDGGGEEVSEASESSGDQSQVSSGAGEGGFGKKVMMQLQNPKHLNPEKALEYVEALKDGASFDVESLSSLFRAGAKALKRDPSLIDLCDKETVTVVGDLHGSLQCLTNVLAEIGDVREGNKAIVFNGDFVDRGPHSLEVIMTLLLLKLAYPDRVFLNRGNHEDSFLSTVYGFEDELRGKYGDDKLDLLWGELSNIFSALPVCCVTKNAAIMHGGIPSDDFHLDEVRAISADERCRARSVLEPRNGTERLLQNIFWSDPDDEEGIRPNESRGAGNMFGPDVARRFLDRHGLLYLVRSHEPWDDGWTAMDCGDERYVVTVFSTSVYDGCANGAVINLHDDGRILPALVPQPTPPAKIGDEEKVLESLVGMIAPNKGKLSDAFEAVAPEAAGGVLTRQQWARVMADALDLPEVDWVSLQPMLAPTTLEECSSRPSSSDVAADHNDMQDTGMIDWRRFLDLHSVALPSGGENGEIDEASVESLYANHAMLLTVFKFLDTDGNGRVDRDEFRTGIDLLNKRLPADQALQDPDKLFNMVDLDDSGEIELDEFSAVFKVI